MADNSKRDKLTINALPTKELFISILVRDVTLRDAIGDLVDNSVDGALRLRPDGNYEGLYIKIDFDAKKNYFSITDNCGGLPAVIARNYAFRFGRPEDAIPTEHSVGIFGIGMKRALFRLGKKFSVTSTAQDSYFEMNVDVEEWKALDDDDGDAIWEFKFNELRENIAQKYPVEERGTTITVTDLHEGVLNTFQVDTDITKLREELQREHLYSIDKGLKIYVNDVLLQAQELQLLYSSDFKTAHWSHQKSPVKAEIYAGISNKEQYGDNGGWYVFCNKRLILGPDQSPVTGWGVKKPIRIPEYHSQFYRFRGYVFLDAADPKDLPWNTAKTSMDFDSPIYKSILQRMIVMMRTVIDFLNQVHNEKRDYRNETIESTPLRDAIKNATIAPLRKIRENPDAKSKDTFVAPPPAERKLKDEPSPNKVWIRYSISPEEYDNVKEYLGIDNQGDIGRRTFEYYYSREIEN